ncbi:MAG: FAD-dependent oxidoreductase [Gemmataceae bacterium]|nr:FAD-dependent oxidoreductase [Gemmataceae bacterium]
MLRVRLSMAGLLLMANLANAIDLPAPTSPNPGLKHWYPVAPLNDTISADVCVYGGTPGGVAAATQAARMGKSVILLCFRRHVGGMTSSGLTATDVGNEKAIGGISREFYRRVGKLRGYMPSEAERTFLTLLAEAKVRVCFEHRLKAVTKEGTQILGLTCDNGRTVRARMFIDASYEGDLLAAAGVRYHVGREANSQYGETINGIQLRDKHQFLAKVDPYRIPGKPESGLLWGISDAAIGNAGDGDKSVQAYCFRMWLTNGADRVAFPKPADYQRDRYQLLLRYMKAAPNAKWNFSVPYGPFELHAGDCNNNGGFSTDMIGVNHGWPEGDYALREKLFQDHVTYQQGLVWFIANDPEIPEATRTQLNKWGLPPGEFPETDHWPHELYVREGRRMISDYVMTESDCLSKRICTDPVGLAAYNMDSHNCRRIVVDGAVKNEGDVQIGCPKPYPISYRSIVPKVDECTNLLVPVCLSSSHISYGSIRMEPVFMVLGQSAGTAASMAIDARKPVQQVDYAKLRYRLLDDKQALEWTAPPAKGK